MKYVLLPLLANGAPCLINIDTITTAYEDTNKEGKRGLKIYTTDGDYTFVDCTLHGLVKRLIQIARYMEPEEEDPEDIDDDIPDPPYYDCEGNCSQCAAEGCKYRTELFFDDDFDGGGPDE